MAIEASKRLYWVDDHLLECQGTIVGVQNDAVALDQTCFYPGGGGQPPDTGLMVAGNGSHYEIHSVSADSQGVIWHYTSALPPQVPGTQVQVKVNAPRREALTRYHTVLHILNTVALRDYNAWITGVQIEVEYSRIDFKIENFSQALRDELEQKVNRVIAQNHTLKSYFLAEEEFHRRKDLLRTLEVQPPVHNGQVRVVEIEGFDAQACGGTHVDSTAGLGIFSITRTENKGRIDERLYIQLR